MDVSVRAVSSQSGARCSSGYLEACCLVNYTGPLFSGLKFVVGKTEESSFCFAAVRQVSFFPRYFLACKLIYNSALCQIDVDKPDGPWCECFLILLPYTCETGKASSVHLSPQCHVFERISTQPQSSIMQMGLVCGRSKCRCTEGLQFYHITVMNKGLSSQTRRSRVSVSCRYTLYFFNSIVLAYKVLINLILPLYRLALFHTAHPASL